MHYARLSACTLILVFLAVYAVAEDDQGNFLSPNRPAANATAKQDIKDTIRSEDILNSKQDAKGNSSPVIMGKNTPAASVNTQSPQPKSRLLSPLNKWHLDLQDTKDRVVELEMCLSNDVVFGKGTIVIENLAQNATATGTFTGKKLNLDILSSDLTLYRLVLTINGKSLSGDYHGYSTLKMPWKGIAMGNIQI
jgi:hypothetical protein